MLARRFRINYYISTIMRKVLFSILLCLFAFNAMAQNEHLKFMGIPLDGTIDAFQKKLEAKGVKYDKIISNSIPIGVRGFKGRFAGEDAVIFVYYDENTKKVYRAKAVVSFSSREMCRQKYAMFKQQLEYKYPQASIEEDKYEYEDSATLNMFLGYINLFQSSDMFSYLYSYFLHIDYNDLINGYEHEHKQLDDL